MKRGQRQIRDESWILDALALMVSWVCVQPCRLKRLDDHELAVRAAFFASYSLFSMLSERKSCHSVLLVMENDLAGLLPYIVLCALSFSIRSVCVG